MKRMRTIIVLVLALGLLLGGCGGGGDYVPRETPAPTQAQQQEPGQRRAGEGQMEYIEPITGSLVVLPDMFESLLELDPLQWSSGGSRVKSEVNQLGDVWWADVAVSVWQSLEIFSLEDYLNYTFDEDDEYTILEDNGNAFRLYSVHEIYMEGMYGFTYYWAFLLEDDYVMEVILRNFGEEELPELKEAFVTFGADAGPEARGLRNAEEPVYHEAVEGYTGTVVKMPKEFKTAATLYYGFAERYEIETPAKKKVYIAVEYQFAEYEQIEDALPGLQEELRVDIQMDELDNESGFMQVSMQTTAEDGGVEYRRRWYYLHGVDAVCVEFMTQDEEYLYMMDEIIIEYAALAKDPNGERVWEFAHVLPASEAILSDAPNIIIEPSDPPFNLGGWKGEDVVRFALDARPGVYDIVLCYSRDAQMGSVDMELWIEDGESIRFSVDATGGWGDYMTLVVGRLEIKEGNSYLLLASADPDESDYIINLGYVGLSPAG